MIEKFLSWDQNNSLFLSFEGPEGAGKTTQIQRLQGFFQSQKRKVIILREPGGTEFGERLRESIAQSEKPLHPLAEAHLFCSARAQLLFETILPTLEEENSVVLLDRYLDSSLVYQGLARQLGIETILGLHQHSPLNLLPHLTLCLDVPVETSLKRLRQRKEQKDYFEKESKAFFQNIREGYQKVAGLFPERIKVINGDQEEEIIAQEILNQLKSCPQYRT